MGRLTVLETRSLKSMFLPRAVSLASFFGIWCCHQSLAFCGFQTQLCLSHHMALSLRVCVFCYKDTSHTGLGPTLLQHDLILTNHTHKDPISLPAHTVLFSAASNRCLNPSEAQIQEDSLSAKVPCPPVPATAVGCQKRTSFILYNPVTRGGILCLHTHPNIDTRLLAGK